MSKKYKFADNDKLYFVSFVVTNWIDSRFVINWEEWKYNSAIDYYGGKGLLEIIKLAL